MPPSSTERDRRRLIAAALAAIALHALAIAALSLIPVLGGSLSGGGGSLATAGSSRSGGGQGPVSLFVSIAENAPHEGSDPQTPSDIPDADPGRARFEPVPRAESSSLEEAVTVIDGADSKGGPEGLAGNESGFGAGTGSGSDIGSDTGGGDTTGTPRGRFVTWLDGAIRARLHYPERARARNAEGTVVVSLTVSPDGKTCEAALAESSGDAALDRAALALVRSLFPAKVAPGTVFSAPIRIRFELSPAP